MNDHRIDRLARRVAALDTNIARRAASAPVPSDSALDGIARAVATPISRRRALLAAGGAVAAASLLRPGRAQADCYPGGPQICSNSHGAKVCVPSDLACCSNENCAIACPYPWRVCASPAICNDTPRLCRSPHNGFTSDQTRYCSQTVKVTNGCVDAGFSMNERGWCCLPSEGCGSDFGECVCLSKCGSSCCKTDEECVSLGLFSGKSCLKKCPKGWHHDGVDCVCDVGQTCGLKCCPAGTECINNRCTKPPPPGKLPSLFDAFGNFGDTINQASGVGGSYARDRAVATAANPVAAALLALAAVNAQGVAAGTVFTDTHADGKYRRKVSVPRVSLPAIGSGAGLSPRAADALRTLLTAEAQGFAYVLACGIALARARGALRHHDTKLARRQVAAAAGFADKAARKLRGVASLRSAAALALRSTGTVEVVVSSTHVFTVQSQVRAHGVPADLRRAVARLGVSSGQLAGVRTALLIDSAGGPVLIAPLTDAKRTQNLTALANELAAFAGHARRNPIARSRPQAKRFIPR